MSDNKLNNLNSQLNAETEEVLPQFCMIAPCVDDVLNDDDGDIVCANRS